MVQGIEVTENRIKKIQWMHSLRGLACIVVFLSHIIAIDTNIGDYASGCGKIGAWFFMLLSGFLLIYPHLTDTEDETNSFKSFLKKNVVSYYIKKAIRILPALFIALVLGLLLRLYDIQDTVSLLTFKGGWGHFWYISVIIKFYIISPIFIFFYVLLKRYFKRYMIMYILLMSSVIIFFSLFYKYTDYIENSIRLVWFIPTFALGILLACIYQGVKDEEYKRYDFIILLITLLICSQTPLLRKILFGIEPSSYLQNKYINISICLCLIILCVKRSRILKKSLEKSKLLCFIADYSLEIYLFHYIVLLKCNELFSGNTVACALATIVISLFFSIIINRSLAYVNKHFHKWIVAVSFLCLFLFIFIGRIIVNDNNEIKDRLYVPTMINRINNDYFIVDCWHSRIIYSDSLSIDLRYWKCLTDEEYIGGHTVCSDGELILADNTDNSQILVYKKDNGGYKRTQTFYNVKGRPHFIVYDDKRHLFYAVASLEAKIYVFENANGILKLSRIDKLMEIEESYVRSISVIEDKLYCVSGPGCINEYIIGDSGFTFEKTYNVPDKYVGMNQIVKIEDYYYITINTDSNGSVDATTIFRCKDLCEIEEGKEEDLYEKFGFVGQPYFITNFDNEYYITEISADCGNGIKKFVVSSNEISSIKTVYYWQGVLNESRDLYNERENHKNFGEKELVDLFIFSGQSNMSGKGDSTQAPKVIKGYEYRSISNPDILNDISEPFGIFENKEDGINDTWENMSVYRKKGSMVSAFANAYYKLTGIPIVGVSASEGNTTVSDWLPGSKRYTDLVDRIDKAKKFITESDKYVLNKTYIVWCQGESDGDIGTTQEQYSNMLKEFVDSLIDNKLAEHCFLIEIGEKNDENPISYKSIRDAQEELCNDYKSLTKISSFYGLLDKGMMIDEYHYTQDGYNLVGEEAGNNAGMYVLGIEP